MTPPLHWGCIKAVAINNNTVMGDRLGNFSTRITKNPLISVPTWMVDYTDNKRGREIRRKKIEIIENVHEWCTATSGNTLCTEKIIIIRKKKEWKKKKKHFKIRPWHLKSCWTLSHPSSPGMGKECVITVTSLIWQLIWQLFNIIAYIIQTTWT